MLIEPHNNHAIDHNYWGGFTFMFNIHVLLKIICEFVIFGECAKFNSFQAQRFEKINEANHKGNATCGFACLHRLWLCWIECKMKCDIHFSSKLSMTPSAISQRINQFFLFELFMPRNVYSLSKHVLAINKSPENYTTQKYGFFKKKKI